MSRPVPSYGFSREIHNKIKSKYSTEMEQEARLWIEAVTGEKLGPDPDIPIGEDAMQKCLKDGIILAKLMNKLMPSSITDIKPSAMAFVQMDNIGKFLKAAENYGVKKDDLFQTVCLFEKTNMVQVITAIHALGRAAQRNNFQGPCLGPRESTMNKREFSQEKLEAGKQVIGLQMGTNQMASQAGISFGQHRQIMN